VDPHGYVDLLACLACKKCLLELGIMARMRRRQLREGAALDADEKTGE
jgi:hypothetical protein